MAKRNLILWVTGAAALGVMSVAQAPPVASDKTVTLDGVVSDSRCNGNHSAVQNKQGGPANFSRAECTASCIAAGEKYVFVDTDRNRVYSIVNPGEASKYSGEKVEIVATVNGDSMKIQKIDKKI